VSSAFHATEVRVEQRQEDGNAEVVVKLANGDDGEELMDLHRRVTSDA